MSLLSFQGKYKTVGGKKMVTAGCVATKIEACTGDIANGEVCKSSGDVEVRTAIKSVNRSLNQLWFHNHST